MAQMNFLKQTLFCALAVLIGVASPMKSDAQIARFDSNLGSFDVQLFGNQTPATVANFLFYINNGNYVDTIIHRSVPGFVVQGGGFDSNLSAIATAPPVINEPGISNTRGTIALARVGGQVNSGTSQFFFNLADNTGLDTVDEGFTVFGEVLGDGLDILDQINALSIANLSGPLSELPLLDSAQPPSVDPDEVVVFSSITIVSVPEPSCLGILLLTGSLLATRRRRV